MKYLAFMNRAMSIKITMANVIIIVTFLVKTVVWIKSETSDTSSLDLLSETDLPAMSAKNDLLLLDKAKAQIKKGSYKILAPKLIYFFIFLIRVASSSPSPGIQGTSFPNKL